MNAAENLILTAANLGLDVCFANPGTTELPFVAALAKVPGIRSVLCLFEGVCTGAADGYARMTGRPALTLLHLGPGFANGIANLHNAHRAHSPVVNLIGDQATWHRVVDAPLTTDVEGLANVASSWVRTSRSASELSNDLADAVAASIQLPGQIATLIVPHDFQTHEANGPATVRTAKPPLTVDTDRIQEVTKFLRSNKKVALLLGGRALGERGLKAAQRVADATGCQLFCEPFPARIERGWGMPTVERLPYFPESILSALAPYSGILLAGASEPISYFGYDGYPARLVTAEQQLVHLANISDDVTIALEMLADEVAGAIAIEVNHPPRQSLAHPTGPLSSETICAAIAIHQPEGAVIVDEGATTSAPYFALSRHAPRHSQLTLTGGAIGQGMPCATGAALACPDRKIISLQADGSGMYTLQSLWTQARERLNVTTLIFANRRYRILEIELARVGHAVPSALSSALCELVNPHLDWVHLANGMGVKARRVESTADLLSALEESFAAVGPELIEVVF